MTEKTPPMKVVTTDYLEAYGVQLVKNGYRIVPIAPGTKVPPFDDWQKLRATTGMVERWIKDDFGRMGVGIMTTDTPAIDLDIEDEVVADEVEAWIVENIGAAPIRYGNGAKRLLLYRTDEPFRKIYTPLYIGEFDFKCKVEVLGDGQQFVAYHIHPDTNLPYRWTTTEEPINTVVADLPVLTREKAQQFVDWFNAYCQRNNYRLTGRAALRQVKYQEGQVDRDNWNIDSAPPVDMPVDELRERLMLVQDNESYDNWFQVGMALYHQFDGSDEGMELWSEWSEPSSKFDRAALVKKWRTFDVEGKGRAPLTAAFILKLANEAEAENAAKATRELVDRFATVKDDKELALAIEATRVAEIDKMARIRVRDALRKAWARLNDGDTLAKSEAMKMLSYKPDDLDMPDWLREWVYDAPADKFFSVESKIHLTQQAFDAVNNRKAFTKEDKLNGLDGPSRKASDLALNKYMIPWVVGVRYMPGQENTFTEEGDLYANSYSERGVPMMPRVDEMLPRDKKNIERVKRHFRHLLPNEDEARMLMDWIAYVVQCPGEKITYSVFLQGVEGDGKSFLAMLLRAIIGARNARIINAGILESQFTGWAEGQCFVCIEEVRLLSHNRYDIMNSIKPFASNPIVNVHPKGKEPYDIINTSNYMLLSNFQDAMPINKDDRRYLVLFSQWQSKEDLMAFMANEPDYYSDLYQAIADSAGALRRFFMDHEFSPDFDPKKPAPVTVARSRMINQARSDFIRALTELIETENRPGLSADLLDLTNATRLLSEMAVSVPEGRHLASELDREGFHRIGRVLIGRERVQLWTQNPSKWTTDDGSPKGTEIRNLLGPVIESSDLDDKEEL